MNNNFKESHITDTQEITILLLKRFLTESTIEVNETDTNTNTIDSAALDRYETQPEREGKLAKEEKERKRDKRVPKEIVPW